MNNIILLLHGFKRNDENDFEELEEYFDKKYDLVMNEVYFENYKKETLNEKHVHNVVSEIAKKINYIKPKRFDILGYSTGSIVAPLVKSKISKDIKVTIFSISPPTTILLAKWVPESINSLKMNRKLKNKMGKERYNRLKKVQEEHKTIEKYPVKIAIFINSFRKKYRKNLYKETDIYFLLSSIDTFVKTKTINKRLSKFNHNITLTKYKHEEITRKDKEILINWIEGIDLNEHNNT